MSGVTCISVFGILASMIPSGNFGARATRWKRRALARLRGRLDLDRLVAHGLELGDAAYIADDVFLDPGFPWLISIGDGATLTSGAVILAHDASMRRRTGHTLLGRVVIGERVFIGMRSIILPGSTVGDDSVIGSGAVVKGNIPRGSVVVGNPAKIIGDVESFAQRHREALTRGPVWPYDGWVIETGITDERKREQHEALDPNSFGYLLCNEVPDDVRLIERKLAAVRRAAMP